MKENGIMEGNVAVQPVMKLKDYKILRKRNQDGNGTTKDATVSLTLADETWLLYRG